MFCATQVSSQLLATMSASAATSIRQPEQSGIAIDCAVNEPTTLASIACALPETTKVSSVMATRGLGRLPSRLPTIAQPNCRTPKHVGRRSQRTRWCRLEVVHETDRRRSGCYARPGGSLCRQAQALSSDFAPGDSARVGGHHERAEPHEE